MKTEEIIIVIMAVVLGLFILGSGFGGVMGFGNYGCGMMSGFGGIWLFGWLFMSLIIIALILLSIWLTKQIKNPKQKNRRQIK